MTELFRPYANWRPKYTTAEYIELHKDLINEDQDSKTVRRINNQIARIYPQADFKITKNEYLAAKSEALVYMKDRVGPNGNPDRRYDRDAKLSWYPADCKGKVCVELRSDRDSHGKVAASSYQFLRDYAKADTLNKTWLDFKAGNALKRHCERNSRVYVDETKNLNDYCKLVPEHQRSPLANEFVRQAESKHRQAAMDFRTTARGHLWKEHDVPFQPRKQSA